MSVINGNSSELIVKNGLILNLDAGNRKSYISGSNTMYDLSGNNNNGSLINGPTFDSINGGSIVFDGNDDFVSASISTPTSSIYSVSLWVYPTATTVGSAVFSSNGYFLGGPGNKPYLQIGGGLKPWQFNDIFPNTSVNINTWYHLTGVQTSTTQYLYINGTLAASGSATSTSGNTFNFGKRTDNVYFTGKISSAQIHLNKALSESEVLQNYNANKSRFATSSLSISNVPRVPTNGLILSLDPSNPRSYVSGSNTIYDLSGNNVTASVYGNPVYSSEGNGTIVFDGVNDYIRNNSYTPNANTISVWLKINSTKNVPIIYVGNDVFNSGLWSWSIFIYNSILNFNLNAGGSLTATNLIPVNEWIHWTIVRSDTNSKSTLYKNGLLYTNLYSPTLANPYGGFGIGGSGGTYGELSLGLLEMYDRPLTHKEVRNLYTSTKDRYRIRQEPYIGYIGTVLHLDAGNQSSYTNGSTNWYDLSGLGNHSKLLNGTSYSSTEGSGSLVFDGINDYVSADYTGSLNSYTNTNGNMSAEVWFKLAKFQNDWVRIFGKSGGSGRVFGLWAGASSQSLYQRWGPNGNIDVVPSTPLSASVWTHVVSVTSGSTHTTYFNGVYAGSSTGASEFATSDQGYTIGYGAAHTYFTGSISMVKLYNYPLTAAEVSQSYNATKARYGL